MNKLIWFTDHAETFTDHLPRPLPFRYRPHNDRLYRPHTDHKLTTYRPHTDHAETFTDHLPTTSLSLPTTYRPPLPTPYRSHTDTYRPRTDHIPTTYRSRSDHVPITYRPRTDHIPTDQLIHNSKLECPGKHSLHMSVLGRMLDFHRSREAYPPKDQRSLERICRIFVRHVRATQGSK